MCQNNGVIKTIGKFYKVPIVPSLLYGPNCWPIEKTWEKDWGYKNGNVAVNMW